MWTQLPEQTPRGSRSDNLRGQAYNMKANRLALNKVSSDPAASAAAYKAFWSEVGLEITLDL